MGLTVDFLTAHSAYKLCYIILNVRKSMSRPRSATLRRRSFNETPQAKDIQEYFTTGLNTTREESFDLNFVRMELMNRIQEPESQFVGIVMPEQAHIPRDYWSAISYTSPTPKKAVTSRSPVDEQSFKMVCMGNPTVRKYVQPSHKVRDLPRKTREAHSPEPYPHYYSKPSNKPMKRDFKTPQPVIDYVAFKYIGNTDNVFGTYTSKIPASTKRDVKSRALAEMPKGMDTIKVNQKPRRHKRVTKRGGRDLFELSVSPKKPKPQPPEFHINPDNPFYTKNIDEDTEAFIETDGKLIPLRSSSIARPTIDYSQYAD